MTAFNAIEFPYSIRLLPNRSVSRQLAQNDLISMIEKQED